MASTMFRPSAVLSFDPCRLADNACPSDVASPVNRRAMISSFENIVELLGQIWAAFRIL